MVAPLSRSRRLLLGAFLSVAVLATTMLLPPQGSGLGQPAAGDPAIAAGASGSPASPTATVALADAAAPAADPVEVVLLDVAPGDTLEALFRQYGLSLVDMAGILEADAARKNLRILRPGDVIEVRHDAGRVLTVRRELGITEALEIRRDDADLFQAEVVRLPLEHREVVANGLISSSLFEAAADARVSEQLVMNLANIFAWDIDFVRDISRGDEFAVVYEELWRDGQKLGEGDILAAEFVNRGKSFKAVRFAGTDDKPAYYTADGRPMRKAFMRAPVKFTRISSGFNPNRRHPILNTIRAHRGVDYAAPTGTSVIAAGDGKVIFRGWKSGYGNTVILQHGGNVTTLYAHLSRFSGQAPYGARVGQGDIIGYVGATGLATAPHLHYEYRKNGVHLNPRTVPLPDATPLQGQQLLAFQGEAKALLDRLDSRRSVLAANLPVPGAP